MRKSYHSSFKAKVALEAIKGERTLAQLSSHYEVHPNLIRQWKKQLLDNATNIFSGRQKKKECNDEEEKAKLFEQIGRLKVELDWLKKKCIIMDS